MNETLLYLPWVGGVLAYVLVVINMLDVKSLNTIKNIYLSEVTNRWNKYPDFDEKSPSSQYVWAKLNSVALASTIYLGMALVTALTSALVIYQYQGGVITFGHLILSYILPVVGLLVYNIFLLGKVGVYFHEHLREVFDGDRKVGYELDFRINLLPQLPYLKSISILLLLGCQYLIFTPTHIGG